MRFLPYRIWDDPPIVAFQDRREQQLYPVLRELKPGTHVLLHCSGTTSACLRSFRRLSSVQATFPSLRFHLVANTDAELAAFRALGLAACYGPVSLYVDEQTFRPKPVPKLYDAVYVARFTPGERRHFKRHLLAAQVTSLSFITFALSRTHESLPAFGPFSSAFHSTYPELRHAAVNDREWTSEEVADGISSARVQLALSAAEGCMLCFTEGLLCGIPAVSTPCDSARTEFFEPELVSVVRAEPRAVADGVREMVARGLDPLRARQYALARQRAMRWRYAEYVAGTARADVDHVYAHLFEQTGGVHRLAYTLENAASARQLQERESVW